MTRYNRDISYEYSREKGYFLEKVSREVLDSNGSFKKERAIVNPQPARGII